MRFHCQPIFVRALSFEAWERNRTVPPPWLSPKRGIGERPTGDALDERQAIHRVAIADGVGCERALSVQLAAGSAILGPHSPPDNPTALAGASEARQIGANSC